MLFVPLGLDSSLLEVAIGVNEYVDYDRMVHAVCISGGGPEAPPGHISRVILFLSECYSGELDSMLIHYHSIDFAYHKCVTSLLQNISTLPMN